MSFEEHTTPDKLERYAFLYSLTRMVIAAFSLFFGARPIAYEVLGNTSGVYSLLQIFWLISGAAAAYLGYRWYTGGQMVFSGKTQLDLIAFGVMVVTGVNLGIATAGQNIGMGMVWGMSIAALLFKVTAVVYLMTAYYLWQRWRENGQKVF